jgi:hypothetical protein
MTCYGKALPLLVEYSRGRAGKLRKKPDSLPILSQQMVSS